MTDDIVGIFDLDNASQGRGTLGFLSAAEREGRVVPAGDGLLPRSVVLAQSGAKRRDGGARLFLTAISSQTLKKRAAAPAADNYI